MKTILYTGARSGIAAKVIDQLKDQDYEIYVTVHTDYQCQIVSEKYQGYPNIHCFKLDITDEEDLKKIRPLKIDILINHAAIGEGGSILEMPIEKVKENFDVNVFSSFRLLQVVAKGMMERKTGKIILMSSLASMFAIPFLGVYSATKASISMLGRTLQKELKLIGTPIDVVLIEPGMYHTGFNQVMLENKYEWMKQKSYFERELEIIKKRETIFFSIFEKQNVQSIVRKIVKAIETEHPKNVYRAPFSQAFFAKLVQLFH